MIAEPRKHVACTRCIMSLADDPSMTFDDDGVCNVCRSFDTHFEALPKTEEESRALLEPVIERIRKTGEGKPYDCVIGISGGVDSTYIALLMRRFGLRPLAVHFDNGWNSELAVENIDRIVTKLDLDLVTYVIDWNDFRELQLAYLRSSVVDIEVLTDHAIYGALYEIAIKNDVRHIISGVNVATEDFLLKHWIYDKMDYINIQDIYRKHGNGKKLKNYPFLSGRRKRRIASSGIEIVPILNLLQFDVKQAREEIEREIGWRPYDGKHHESIFTRFYQGYILPRKFGIDKRKAHLSNLICSGQMTRDEALREFQQDVYSPEQREEDLEFVCKKLQLSREEFDEIMRQPRREHHEFATYRWFFARNPLLRPLLPLWRRYQRLRA